MVTHPHSDAEDFDPIHVSALLDSYFLVPVAYQDALILACRGKQKKDPIAWVHQTLAKQGLCFEQIQADGGWQYRLDATTFAMRFEKMAWPYQFWLWGNYFDPSSFYTWRNYVKTPYAELDAIFHETLDAGYHLTRCEDWEIHQGVRQLVSTRSSRNDTPCPARHALYAYPDIDTRAWRVEDKAWVAARKAQWGQLEPILRALDKNTAAIAVLKSYFLKGAMPNWAQRSRTQANPLPHLDLCCLIWLHPAEDDALFADLRAAYLAYPYTTANDVRTGLANLFRLTSWRRYGSGYMAEAGWCEVALQTFTDAARLFLRVYGDLNQFEDALASQPFPVQKPRPSLRSLHDWAGNLLPQPAQTYVDNPDFVYQYPLLFAWWCRAVALQGFTAQSADDQALIVFALCRIHAFDAAAESESMRSRWVQQVREAFAQGSMAASLTTVWHEIQAGTLCAVDLWDEDQSAFQTNRAGQCAYALGR